MIRDGSVTNPAGEALVGTSDEFERAELTKSWALADKQQQEKTEATTRRERQTEDFTAGFLLEPTNLEPWHTSR